MKEITNNSVHLCESCCNEYPNCDVVADDVVFGDGKGKDNVAACNKYEAIQLRLN